MFSVFHVLPFGVINNDSTALSNSVETVLYSVAHRVAYICQIHWNESPSITILQHVLTHILNYL